MMHFKIPFRWVRWSLIGLILVGSYSFSRLYSSPVEVNQSDLDPLLITESSTDVIFSWHMDPAVLVADGSIQPIPEFEQESRVGFPQLPVQSHLVALPLDADPTVEIILHESESLLISEPVPLVPRPSGVTRDLEGEVIGGAYEPSDPLWSDADYHSPFLFEEIGVMRGIRIGRLTFLPIRPDRAEGQFEVTRALQLRLSYHSDLIQSEAGRSLTEPADQSDMRQQINALVVNRTDFPTPGRATTRTVANTSQANPIASMIINVTNPGMTEVTYADLQAAWPDLGLVDPATLYLTREGVPVRYSWHGDDSATFDAGESLRFYAQPFANRWTEVDAYTLAIIEDEPLSERIETSLDSPAAVNPVVGSLLQTISFEENHIYTPLCLCGNKLRPGHDGDRHVWAEMRRPGTSEIELPFPLPDLDSTLPATITVDLHGFSSIPNVSNDHLVGVTVNDVLIGQVVWDGKAVKHASFTIPANRLGINNSLRLTLLENDAPLDAVWLDRFQVTYSRAADRPISSPTELSVRGSGVIGVALPQSESDIVLYDVTDRHAPVILVQDRGANGPVSWSASGDAIYHVQPEGQLNRPSRIKAIQALNTDPNIGATYLIITHPDFVDGLGPLIERRQADGLTVAVETVDHIYDHYSHGMPVPAGIQAFVQDAYNSWAVPPEYVLLVGDGSTDPKGFDEASRANYIPPFLANVDPWMGETAADNRYVAVDGNDNLPDIMLGRLPVNSLDELETVIKKIELYETADLDGGWHTNILFAADNRDSAGNFGGFNNKIIGQFTPYGWTHLRHYLDDEATNVEAVAQDILSWFDDGVGIVVYSGHASLHQWAVERIFHFDDVDGLANGAKLPILLQMSCLSGSYHRSSIDALNEGLVRHAAGGTAAAWGPTGLAVLTGQDSLAKGAFRWLVIGSETTMGELTQSGYAEVYKSQPGHKYLVDAYLLLGDPAMKVNLEYHGSAYMPYLRNAE